MTSSEIAFVLFSIDLTCREISADLISCGRGAGSLAVDAGLGACSGTAEILAGAEALLGNEEAQLARAIVKIIITAFSDRLENLELFKSMLPIL